MKRFFFVILFLMGSFSLFAESAKSIEGVVEVAGKGELPSGYFGKTAGYLPGDSVSITNPNTGMTLQILNLGTLDESSGIAILVSEETANSLGIERNSGVKVRLAKRSGFFDENVSGDAVLDKSTLPKEEVTDSEEDSDAVRVAGVPLIEDEEEDEAEEEDAVEAFLSSDKDDADFDNYSEEEFVDEDDMEDFEEEEESEEEDFEEDLETEEEEDDEYMPIILVPTEPETPPESEEEDLEEEEESEEEVPIEPEPTTETTSPDLASHLLESEDMLERNCYYVQFATFSSAANAESTLGKFSKYPIAVVKTKDSYRMLVGPLSVDEYGAVLARLKDVGFKDAFVVKR